METKAEKHLFLSPGQSLIDFAIVQGGEKIEEGKCLTFAEARELQEAREIPSDHVIVDDEFRPQESAEAAHHYEWRTYSGVSFRVFGKVRGSSLQSGVVLIGAERNRQIAVKGYTAKHDDLHRDGSLARAAACYASTAAVQSEKGISDLPSCFVHKDWPWERQDFRPANDPIQNLKKAGALVAAEIERLQRLAALIDQTV